MQKDLLQNLRLLHPILIRGLSDRLVRRQGAAEQFGNRKRKSLRHRCEKGRDHFFELSHQRSSLNFCLVIIESRHFKRFTLFAWFSARWKCTQILPEDS